MALAAGYAISSGTVALSGTTAKTLANIINGSNAIAALCELSASTDGVTASAVPGVLDLCKSTQGAAGTAGGSTINQIRGPTRTTQSTAGYNYSAEPTTLTPIKSWYLPQYNGLLILQYPLGRETSNITSANALALRYTPSATVNARANLEWEE